MNEIEREIENSEDNIKKEEGTIKYRINRNVSNDKKKNIILYSVIGVLFVLFIILVVYIFDKGKKLDSDIPDDNDEIVNSDVNNSIEDIETNNSGYVSCVDNTALLNVRNSTNGDIIDGLSCYKRVTIENELDGTDNCDNWYKISYDKNGSNYIGYVCGTYIKKLDISENVVNNARMLIDKANKYYDDSIVAAYCGETTETKNIDFGNNMVGEYVKSQFKTIEELENYLLSFLDKDLIDIKLEVSDIDNPRYYDNYYMIDGNLYCRNYGGKGISNSYTGNYDIEIVDYKENKYNINVAYQYISENSDCRMDDLSSCSRNDFVYDIKKISINDNVITDMEFHK